MTGQLEAIEDAVEFQLEKKARTPHHKWVTARIGAGSTTFVCENCQEPFVSTLGGPLRPVGPCSGTKNENDG